MEASDLKNLFSNKCSVFKENSSHYIIRCPLCGDSQKSFSHGHLYISKEFPHPWFCHRCNEKSGSLSINLLKALELYSKDTFEYVEKINKVTRKNIKEGKSKIINDLILPLIDRKDPDENNAILFLERRLNFEFSEFHFKRYKIITNLYKFLELNKIDFLNVDSRKEADRLCYECIGFLSADRSHIIFRSINPNYKGNRYTNYPIFQRGHEASKIFCISKEVEFLLPEHRIVISEGIIDLIQIERLYEQKNLTNLNYIALATNGSSHKSALNWIIGLGAVDFELDLYIDNEEKCLKYIHQIPSWNHFINKKKLHIWKNTFIKEKDFGIDEKRITRTKVFLNSY